MKRQLPPQPKVLLGNGKRPCRGCGGQLPTRRHSWCSNECKERHYMALSTHARARVWERDRGVCALCGADTGFLDRMYWVFRRRDDLDAFRSLKRAWGVDSDYASWHTPTMWEADHTVPLVSGGTNDLSNYRTLCIPCHRRVTADLARSRSRRALQTELGLTQPVRRGSKPEGTEV